MTRLRIAATALAIMFLAVPASAQTTGATAAGDLVAVPVWPTATVALPAQPVAASFSLGQIDGVAPQLITGVTAKGYARKVAVDNQSIGQVLVMSVSKGDREETISTEGLTAQFDAKETSQLFPEKTLEVKGSKAALVAALERLAKPKATDTKAPPPTDAQNNQTSGGKSQNGEASNYKSPTVSADPAPAATPQTPDPVIDTRTTTDGCPMRIDTVQGVAVQQSKIQTFTNGALTTDGTCSDSGVSYTIKKSYSTCPTDIVDLTALQAWPQFALYYTDGAGENHTVSDCAKDTDTPYTITEDESQCSISLDFADAKAIPQAALIYINRNNATVQARGCANSTKSAAITMIQSTANCSLRNDFAAGLTYEQVMWTYVRGGVTYQAAPCGETGRTFAQETVYADASGNYLCTPITNLTTKKVTLQSRLRISIDGAYQFITECTPDKSSTSILPTTDGCMDPSKWTHDLSLSLSYGQERFYYLKTDASRVYVTDCQTSTVTYPQNVTITGYQIHDDQLWAYPLSTVTIQVNGSPYTIASSEVLPGAPQLAYVLNGTVDQPDGNSTYNECSAYRETARYEQWQRPDGSIYLKQIGVGTPTGPVNVCNTNVIATRAVITGNGSTGLNITNGEANLFGTASWTTFNVYQNVNKTETKNMETGIVQATTCTFANNTWNGWQADSVGQFCNWSYPRPASCGPVDHTTQTLTVPPCPF